MQKVRLNPDAPTVEIIEGMFPCPRGADSKWAYRHGAYKEVRKMQRRGAAFAVEWSDDIWAILILGDVYWYHVPPDMLIVYT